MIEAAGGAIWRRTADGEPQVLIVHRPRYDDWTLPKGKLEADETHLEAALREVEEETGLRCTPGDELTETRYEDHKGRAKRVRYWAMQPSGGSFEPNNEVDGIRWLTIDAAASLVSYQHDAQVLEALGQLPVVRS